MLCCGFVAREEAGWHCQQGMHTLLWFCGMGGGKLTVAAGHACLVVVLSHDPCRMGGERLLAAVWRMAMPAPFPQNHSRAGIFGCYCQPTCLLPCHKTTTDRAQPRGLSPPHINSTQLNRWVNPYPVAQPIDQLSVEIRHAFATINQIVGRAQQELAEILL